MTKALLQMSRASSLLVGSGIPWKDQERSTPTCWVRGRLLPHLQNGANKTVSTLATFTPIWGHRHLLSQGSPLPCSPVAVSSFRS